jgi:hypothetical protein
MTLRRTWPIDKGLPNAIDLRSTNRWVWPVDGIVPNPADLGAPASRTIISAGSGWGVNIAAFHAVTRRASALDGVSFVTNDATVNNAVTVPGAPATGSRIDVVYVWTPDPTKGDPLTTPSGETVPRAVPVFGILAGTAANGGLGATPTKPSLATYGPDGAEELGTITTASTGTAASNSVIAQTFAYATQVGSPRVFRTLAEAKAAVTLTAGQECLIGALPRRKFFYDGTSWVLSYSTTPLTVYNANGAAFSFGSAGAMQTRQTVTVTSSTAARARIIWRAYLNSQGGNVAGYIRLLVNGQQVGPTAGDIRYFTVANSPLVMFEEWDAALVEGNNTIELQMSSDSASGASSWDLIRWEVVEY